VAVAEEAEAVAEAAEAAEERRQWHRR
jgi:hypothetical protein